MAETRKLAAIVVSDVVGYSRLAGTLLGGAAAVWPLAAQAQAKVYAEEGLSRGLRVVARATLRSWPYSKRGRTGARA